MMDPTDKDTKHIKYRSKGTVGDIEYTKENEKGKVNQLELKCGEQERPTQLQNRDMRIIQSQQATEYSREPKHKQANGTQATEFIVYQGWVKTARSKLDDQ